MDFADMEFKDRIAHAIADFRLSVIARQIGISSSAIAQVVSGRSKSLRADHLMRLAKITGYPLEWLIYGGDLQRTSNDELLASMQFARLPLLDAIAATQWREQTENLALFNQHETWFIAANSFSKNAFAFRVTGATGSEKFRHFRSGDIVLIDPAVTPRPQDYVLAKHQHDVGAIFARYQPKPPQNGVPCFELATLYEDGEVLSLNAENAEIIGVMMEHRHFRDR